MRWVSMPWFMGLCLSLAACSGAAAEPTDAETNDPSQLAPAGTDDENAAAPGEDDTAALDATDPSVPASNSEPPSEPPAPEGQDAGAGDAGGGGVKQIPMPSFGKILASASTGELCQFTVNGYAKGTSTVLDLAVVAGSTVVSCKRTDGTVATKTVNVAANETTTVVLPFAAPIPVAPGTLVAVAVDGSCSFSINGSPKGTTSTLKISLAPAAYTVTCKPSTGAATMSRSVIIKSGETAMAMFHL